MTMEVVVVTVLVVVVTVSVSAVKKMDETGLYVKTYGLYSSPSTLKFTVIGLPDEIAVFATA